MNRKEKILGFMNTDAYVPLKEDELAMVLDVPVESMSEFRQLLKELEDEGSVRRTKRKRYICVKSEGNTAVGTITVSMRGFGFVTENDAKNGENDIYISAEDLNGALDGDSVMVRLDSRSHGKNRRREGAVTKILKRERHTVTGKLVSGKARAVLLCDDKHIPNKIAINNIADASDGDRVVALITQYPTAKNSTLAADVITVLGRADDVTTHIKAILHNYKVREEFDSLTLQEARSVSVDTDISASESRLDLRNECIFTIDGEDAKDLDDAVSIKKLANGYELGVHIADVSHYVKEGSSLDREAFLRGTSIYFPGCVIPMLPKELSNGICSLNAGEDRLAFSVIMKIDNTGKVYEYNITPSVIRSKYRMTYTIVAAILDGDESLIREYAPLCDDLKALRDLALILMQKRKNRGAIDFDIPEAYIHVDGNFMPTGIEKRQRNIAHRMIEECMLICNETVAEHAFWADFPFIYRIHETPSPEKMAEFGKFIYNFGIRLKGKKDDMHPKSLQSVLDSIKGDACERTVSTYMLRSLMKAKYSPSNEGHFGLAAKYYCHFTSPIRRYPDLAVHRLLKQNISSQNTDKYKTFVQNASQQSTDMEINAMMTERDITDLLKTCYMVGKEGESFSGVISSIIEFGFFVELDNTVEGFVRLESIKDDYYSLDAESKCIRGKRKHKIYSIGDEVKVRLVKADIDLRQIDFMLEKDYVKLY